MEEIEIIPESIQLLKMSDEEYFSEKYKDYISNSKLSLINPDEGGSIEKYLSGFQSDYSESFELGSAVHCIVLQPDSYFVSELDKPTGKLGLFVNYVYELRQQNYKISDAIKEASLKANYYSNSFSDNRFKTAVRKSIDYYLHRIKQTEIIEDKFPIYLSNTMKNKLGQCLSGIYNNKKLKNLLYPEDCEIYNEYAILCEVNVKINGKTTKVKLKGKLDNFTIDHLSSTITLNDLKTTGKPANFFMGNKIRDIDDNGNEVQRWIEGSFQKYHYYRQMGMYLWLLNSAIQANFGYVYKLKANMLLVETIPNFNSKVCPVNGEYIKKGLAEFKQLLIKVVEWTNDQNTQN